MKIRGTKIYTWWRPEYYFENTVNEALTVHVNNTDCFKSI